MTLALIIIAVVVIGLVIYLLSKKGPILPKKPEGPVTPPSPPPPPPPETPGT